MNGLVFVRFQATGVSGVGIFDTWRLRFFRLLSQTRSTNAFDIFRNENCMMLFSFSKRIVNMIVRIKSLICYVVVAAGVFMAGAAHALIVTGGGVDTVTRHFVIDSAMSSVTHDPGMVFDDAAPQTYAISGEFDASFLNYWWSYHLDGDIDGIQGTFIYQESWLTFSNAAIAGNADLQAFVFPNYFARVTGTEISGSATACAVPLGPDMYCSGFDMPPIASLTGTYVDGVLTLQGLAPVAGGNFFEFFSYSIRTNTVPEPGTLALILCGTVGLFVSARRRKSR